MSEWFSITWTEAGAVIASVVLVYLGLILLTRITGLRSFSKMSAPDFAMTVAVGSLFASAVATPDPTVTVALLALAGLFAGQHLLAYSRRHSALARRALDNEPLLLMDGPEMLETNMRRANVSDQDIWAKLREANVLELRQVRAVVFETTGDISVLHSEDPSQAVAEELLRGVRR